MLSNRQKSICLLYWALCFPMAYVLQNISMSALWFVTHNLDKSDKYLIKVIMGPSYIKLTT